MEKTDPRKLGDALGSAFHASETFEQSIALMNALSQYLEEVEIGPDNRFDWVSRMVSRFGSDDYRRNKVFGDYQLPPIWEPNAPHDNGMIGKPSNAAQVEVRRQAYERFCRACLRIPAKAAWGFSQLGALADLAGNFDANFRIGGGCEDGSESERACDLDGEFCLVERVAALFLTRSLFGSCSLEGFGRGE